MSVSTMSSARIRFAFCTLALASFSLVASGVMLGDLVHLPPPCALCILQRFLYLVYCFWALCGIRN